MSGYVPVLLAAALLAGCGSTGTARTTAASIPLEPQDVEPDKGSPGADEPSQGKIDIAIGRRAFERPVMRIRVGQIVVWTDEDDVGHTVRAVDGGLPRSGLIPPRGRFEYTALKAGRVFYQCVVHPEMRGELIVRPVVVARPKPSCRELSRTARHELGDPEGELESHCRS